MAYCDKIYGTCMHASSYPPGGEERATTTSAPATVPKKNLNIKTRFGSSDMSSHRIFARLLWMCFMTLVVTLHMFISYLHGLVTSREKCNCFVFGLRKGVLSSKTFIISNKTMLFSFELYMETVDIGRCSGSDWSFIFVEALQPFHRKRVSDLTRGFA